MLLSCKEKERGRDEPVKPEEVKLQILVADDAFSTLKPGESLQVAYEVKTPADVAYTLSSFQPEGWTVSISTPVGNKGKIGVSLPSDASAGRIMLVADGSNGSCFVKVLGAGTGNDGTVEAYEAVDASGGSLELPSGAGTVHVSSSGDWLSVKGKQLLLSPNTAYDSREALVSFTVDKRECELTLVQAQKDAIVLTANALQAAAAGEILEFVVRANVDVQARCSDTWVKVTPSTKGLEDKVRCGEYMDTVIALKLSDFYRNQKTVETLPQKDLNALIATQNMRGDANVMYAQIEKNRRMTLPFSAFILTIMAVALTSKKKRGGIGFNLALGIGLAFGLVHGFLVSYLEIQPFFLKFSEMFVFTGTMSAGLAMWLPNFVYMAIAAVLYKIAPK